ncbi:tyrosine-type recombinase/integrase [Leptospira alstonii]|uniref:Site-specific recombinase, phage integrase family n=2 Tax=Leptospira alstonii TaxID=28452 RepID=M6D692_9LEPT|nr:tyrosine-type recombinase/integrase [Leptospira alstonii]EMJ94065.1 site-specific recombinase, phage integrase family [Leptospira alstonii serovar Sichuan str. 79601]EQA80419.1 site-specific recombinase, phage integrase family [Leptospira alstonii serovar Pingchang str. 80-412]
MNLIRENSLTTLQNPKESNLNTRNSYQLHINQFNTWNQSESITPDRIQSYLSYLKIKGDRSATIRIAKSALKKGIKQSLPGKANNLAFLSVLDTVFKEMKVDSTKYSLNESAVLSRKEISTLCKNTPKKLSLMIKAFYNSGFRVSELTRIRIKDCFVSNDSLAITIIRKRGKEVTIQNAFPIKLYEAILKTFHSEFIKPKDYLFKNLRSINGYYSRQFLWQEINKYSRRILGKNYSVHDLRHSHASSLLLAGEKIPAIALRLSHEDISTTAKYYLHAQLNPKTLNKVFIN